MNGNVFQTSMNANLDVMINGVDELKNKNFDQVGYNLTKDELEMFSQYDPVKAAVNADYWSGIDRSGLSDSAKGYSQSDMTAANVQAQAASAAAARQTQAQMEM